MSLQMKYVKSYNFVISGIIIIILIAHLATPKRTQAQTTPSKLSWPSAPARSNSNFKSEISSQFIKSSNISPAINEPKFSEPKNSKISEQEKGIGLCVESVCRFYPFTILAWHNIVNDNINGRSVLIYYNDSHQLSVVYDRKVNGETLNFQNSYNPVQLLNFDDKKISEWDPVLGEAISGIRVRQKLAQLPIQVISLEKWLATHPETQVLNFNTGHIRPYGAIFETSELSKNTKIGEYSDRRLNQNEQIAGVYFEKRFIAIQIEKLPIGETRLRINNNLLKIQKFADGSIFTRNANYPDEAPLLFIDWHTWSQYHRSSIIVSK